MPLTDEGYLAELNKLSVIEIEIELKKREDIDQLDEKKESPLHRAARSGYVNLVDALIKVGANKDAANLDGVTPLHYAAVYGHKEVVEVLLKAGVDKEAADQEGDTPLHCAAFEGHKEVAEALLRAGANIEATESDDMTPLHCAANKGHTEVAEALLRAGANTEATESDDMTPLHCAANKGHTEMAEVLLNAGASKDATDPQGATPLHYAAVQGHTEVAAVLLKAGANKEAADLKKLTPLHCAADEGHAGVVEVLLNAKANKEAADQQGNTPLHLAAGNGHNEVVEALLKAGANEKATDQQGDTPLHFAAFEGHTEVVETLLKAGANKEAADLKQYTPLHCAANNGHKEVAEVLLNKGADVHKESKSGDTPLYIAAVKGYDELARSILQVYEQNPCSEFSLAIKRRDERAIATLLKIGVKVPKDDADKLIPIISKDSHLLRILWEQCKPQAEEWLEKVKSFILELEKFNIPGIVNSEDYKQRGQYFNDRRQALEIFIKGEGPLSELVTKLTGYYGYIDEIPVRITSSRIYLAKTLKQEIKKLDKKLAEFVVMQKELETMTFVSGSHAEESRCCLLNKVEEETQAIKTAKQDKTYAFSKEEVFQEMQVSFTELKGMYRQRCKEQDKIEQAEKLKAKYAQNLAALRKESVEEITNEIGFELKKVLLEPVPMTLSQNYEQAADQLEKVYGELTQLRVPEKLPEGEEEDSAKLEKFNTDYAKWKKERIHLKSERDKFLATKNMVAKVVSEYVCDRVAKIKELKDRLGQKEVYQEEVIELTTTVTRSEEQIREYISQKYAFSDVALQTRYIELVKNHKEALESLLKCRRAIASAPVSVYGTEEKTFIKLDNTYQVYLVNVAKEMELNKAKELLYNQSRDKAKEYHLELYNKLAKRVGILTEELREYSKVDAPFYKEWVSGYENIFGEKMCKSPWEVTELEDCKLQIKLIEKQLSKLPEHIKEDSRYKELQEASTKKDAPKEKTSFNLSCEEEIKFSCHSFFTPAKLMQNITFPFYSDLKSIIISDFEDSQKRWLDAIALGKGRGFDTQVKFIFCKMHSLSLMRFFGMLAIAGCNADQKSLFSNLRNFFMHYESELEQEDLFYYIQSLKDVVIGAKQTFLLNPEGYANEIYTKYRELAERPQLSPKVKLKICMCLQRLPDEDVKVEKTFTVITKLLGEFKQLSIYFSDESLKVCLSEVNREFKLAFLSTACQIGEKLQKLSIANTDETTVALKKLQTDKTLWYFLNLCRDVRDAVGHAYGEECKEITYDVLFSKEGILSKLERFCKVKEIDRTISCFEQVVAKQPTVTCSSR